MVPLKPVEVYVIPAITIACNTGVYVPEGIGGDEDPVNGWVTVYVVYPAIGGPNPETNWITPFESYQ